MLHFECILQFYGTPAEINSLYTLYCMKCKQQVAIKLYLNTEPENEEYQQDPSAV